MSKNHNIDSIVVRVYALIIDNSTDSILISDEYQLNTFMTKFPGGGLIPGEGTIDCLKREINEELGEEICNIQHFYTTDFFQQALFYPNTQLISIYYTCSFCKKPKFKISNKPFDFENVENGKQSFRWIKLNELSPDIFTFPIDKYVANLLISK